MFQSNAILASLSAGGTAALRPHLKATHLQQMTVLYEAGDTVKTVYFPTTAVVSLVVTLATGEMTEAAMVGKDGAIGMASALDGKIAMSRAITQLGGDAMVCDPAAFKGAAMQSESLISTVSDMSKPCLRKRSNQRPAWPIMKLMPGFAAGYCTPAICREAITFLSRKNFWLKCLVSDGRA